MDAPLVQKGWGRGWLSDDQVPGDYSSADPTSWPGGHCALSPSPPADLLGSHSLPPPQHFNYKSKRFLS